jgi:hypothetical protein
MSGLECLQHYPYLKDTHSGFSRSVSALERRGYDFDEWIPDTGLGLGVKLTKVIGTTHAYAHVQPDGHITGFTDLAEALRKLP